MSYSIQKEKWNCNLNIGIIKTMTNVNIYKKHFFDLTSNTNFDIKLAKKIFLSMDMTYNGTSVWSTSYFYPIYYASCSIRTGFFKNSLKVRIGYDDIFYTNQQHYIQTDDKIKYEDKSRYAAYHGVKLSVKYIFNKYSEKYQQKNTSSDELKRL